MTEAELHKFHASFDRCMQNPLFFDRFYDRFVRSSPEVEDKFRNTDFTRQKTALKASLYMIQDASVRRNPDYSPLYRIAARHSRGNADIRPEFYELWLDKLVETVAECDPLYGDDVGEVWRVALRPGIDYMIAHY